MNSSVYGINKGRMIKRVAAACLDFIIFALCAVGFTTLMSTIVGYDNYRAELDKKYEEHNVLYEYDPTAGVEDEGSIFCEMKEEGDACYLAWESFYADEEAVNLLNTCTSLTLVTGSVGLFGGALVAHFLIPLLLKNGQSFGKKFMRLAVISKQGIRVRPMHMFLRFLFGIYVIELMVPFYGILYIFSGSPGGIIAVALILGIFVANLIMTTTTPFGSAIHDLVGGTIVVEYDGQAIFDSVDELNKFKEQEKQKNKEYARKKGY